MTERRAIALAFLSDGTPRTTAEVGEAIGMESRGNTHALLRGLMFELTQSRSSQRLKRKNTGGALVWFIVEKR
jgi:hypothetical protein